METKLSTKIKKGFFTAAKNYGIGQNQGIVILDLKVFEKMKRETERLKKEITEQKKLSKIKKIINQGELEYKKGKTIKANSLKEAFENYKSL